VNEIEQKEFEEMAALILKAGEEYYRAKCCEECADFEAMALYNAGYRKQSDTVKEFAEKLKKECHKVIAHNDKAMDNRGMTDEVWYICNGQNDGLDFVLKKMNDLAEQYGKEERNV